MLTATAWKRYKSLIHQYFRTIAEPRAEVNREQFPVGRRKRLPHFAHCITSLTPADVRRAAHSARTGRAWLALFDFPLEWAAKVESAVARWDCPQPGQAIASPLWRTSFSNFVPQSSQTYSKIGIFWSPGPWQLLIDFSAERRGVGWVGIAGKITGENHGGKSRGHDSAGLSLKQFGRLPVMSPDFFGFGRLPVMSPDFLGLRIFSGRAKMGVKWQ